MRQTREREIQKGIGLLKTLRDEIHLDLHLAGMEAKDRWAKTMEPRLVALEGLAEKATRDSRRAVGDAVRDFKLFREQLRPSPK